MISRPVPNSDLPPVLFVHGAWHGPWCWEGWMDSLHEEGFSSYAVELPGHGQPGSPKRIWNRLSHYVTAVEAALDELGDETIVVGHSMGGLVTQVVLEHRDVAQAVLIASVPRRGALRSAIRVVAGDFVNAVVMFPLGTMWTIVRTPEQVRRWFFSAHSADEDVAQVGEKLQNESILAFAGMLTRWPRPAKVGSPVRVMAASQDAIFSVAEETDLATAYGTQVVIIEGAGHDIMADGAHADAGFAALLEMIRSAKHLH